MGRDSAVLEKEGYVRVRTGLSQSLLREFRSTFGNMTFTGPGVGTSISIAISVPAIERLLFHETLIEELRFALNSEEICIFPNVTIRTNSQTPWHVDEAFRGGGVVWKHPSNTEFVQCTVYFQDNDRDGGGLDVIPHSHVFRSEGDPLVAIRKLLTRVTTVATIEGDAILWDGRLLHRSTPRALSGRKNYAVHWTAARPDSDLTGFLAHIVRRGRNPKDNVGVDRRYGEVERFRFKRDAPDSFLAAAKRANVTLSDVFSCEQLSRSLA